MPYTTADIPSDRHISSSPPQCKTRSDPKGCDSSLSTKDCRALSWGDMIAPLSILTQDMTDVPIIDIDTWVCRPIEERKKETERKGKVPRPMNSFMLYRWAYAGRIKRCSRQRSAQVVSSIAGKSWHQEPQNIREKYQRLAQLERESHASAYPDYKFKPRSRKRSSVAEPATDLQVYGHYENNAFEWSSVHGFQITTPCPINDPSWGFYAEGMRNYFVAGMGECFEGGNSGDLFGIPGSGHYSLMCPGPIEFLPSIFAQW
ncbi:unnamed protein product [Penicillium olsonii]|nr:unnamed protein product [Penicillium olsonii]CAG8170253.1 unnamed protein product [Penicillium olsonii]